MKKEVKSFLIGLAVIIPFLIPMGWEFIKDVTWPLQQKKDMYACVDQRLAKGETAPYAVCGCGGDRPSRADLDDKNKRLWLSVVDKFFKEAPKKYQFDQKEVLTCYALIKVRNIPN